MRITVVIPLYNKEPFIERAVTSVLEQTHQDFQIIIVDDGSTDKSVQIASSIKDDRIQIHSQQNAGPGPARNTGVGLADTDWVAFLDADDEWYPDHLEEIAKIIAQHPSAALVSTQFQYQADGQVDVERQLESIIKEIYFFHELTVRARRPVWSSAAAIRRSACGIAPFPGLPNGEDTACWISIALEHPVAISEKQTAIYRQGTGGITDSRLKNDRLFSYGRITSFDQITYTINHALQSATGKHAATLKRWVDREIWSFIRSALYRGRVDLARDVASLYRHHRPYYHIIWAALSVPIVPLMAVRLSAPVVKALRGR